MTTRTSLHRLATTLAAAAVVGAACTSAGDGAAGGDIPPAVRLSGIELASALTPYDECGALLDDLHERAADTVTAYGFDGGIGGPVALEERAFATAGDDAGAASAPQAAPLEPDVDYSTTNVQEAGVDEPDTVKTDGRRLFAVARNAVHEVDVSTGVPRVAAELPVPDDGSHLLLLDGNELLVITSGWAYAYGGPEPLLDAPAPGADVAIAPVPGEPTTTFTLFDVSEPGAPRITATMEVDGTHLASRMIDGTVRAVVQTGAAPIAYTYPTRPGPAAEAEAVAANHAAIDATTVEDWLPQYRWEDRRTGSALEVEGTLPDCTDVYQPPEFAGLGSMSVLTLDLDKGLRPDDTVTVLASGENVYASTDSLYIATNRWIEPEIANDIERFAADPPDLTTEIHKLDIRGDGPARYVGSGQVRGHLLNQFSMSEHAGNLRVASTDGLEWWGPEGPATESFVTVLGDAGDHLEVVGQVGGLGRGERIQAVRFLGDVGYVVTFRQTDPLYTVDLSDPSAPVVVGELKILGYSSYLHPIGDGLLIGVGQAATEEGRVLGTQVSLFDVSDPATPRLLHAARLGSGSSTAEFDHHAFLYWPATGLTVLPVQLYDNQILDGGVGVSSGSSSGSVGSGVADDAVQSDAQAIEPTEPVAPDEPGSRPDVTGPDEPPAVIAEPPVPPGQFNGAIGLHVARDGISEVGRVSHTSASPSGWWVGITRSVVVGDSLFTISDAGVMASALDTLAEQAFTPFPA